MKNLPCPISNWKYVVLNTRLTKWHIQGISSLLKNSPSLEEFTIHLDQCLSNSYIVRFIKSWNFIFPIIFLVYDLHYSFIWFMNIKWWQFSYFELLGRRKGVGIIWVWCRGLLNSQKINFRCLEHHRKSVKILGFVPETYVIQLVEFLLKSALVLEKMEITSKRNSEFYQQDRLTVEKLLKFS